VRYGETVTRSKAGESAPSRTANLRDKALASGIEKVVSSTFPSGAR
jgi:hypothetical protein